MVGSDGGASLLRNPEVIYQVTQSIRKAIPKNKTLSVKIRLGWDSIEQRFEIADAVQQGGANEIAIHGRTKEDGYRADKINWQAIGDIRQQLSIPVIANGEIFTPQDAEQCLEQSGCQDIMLARGAINIPNLANMIRYQDEALIWPKVTELLQRYANSSSEQSVNKPLYHSARIKQWLTYLKVHYPEAATLLQQIRVFKSQQEMIDGLQQYTQ